MRYSPTHGLVLDLAVIAALCILVLANAVPGVLAFGLISGLHAARSIAYSGRGPGGGGGGGSSSSSPPPPPDLPPAPATSLREVSVCLALAFAFLASVLPPQIYSRLCA
jgi:hypothetical protein